MATKSPLLNMLAELAKNPAQATQFEADPGAVMDAHGLSSADQAKVHEALGHLKSGNREPMRNLVADEAVHPDTCFVTIP